MTYSVPRIAAHVPRAEHAVMLNSRQHRGEPEYHAIPNRLRVHPLYERSGASPVKIEFGMTPLELRIER